MAKLLALCLAVAWLRETSGEVNVSDYIYWKKEDISAWHQFFPSRALEEEQQTLMAAEEAVQDLSAGLNMSLSMVVSFQAQELTTAQLLSTDTDAEGCVNGIASYMPNAIDDEYTAYLDCAADAFSKLQRLNNSWARTKATYLTAYQKALSGIDYCHKNYPNSDSINRLISCVEYMNKNYFAVANATQSAMFPSPSMTYFQNTVVQCASTAAQNVAAKGWKFLGMLVECSKLNPNIDPVAYADQLDKWPGYNDTLQSQINSSQSKNYDQVWAVEREMLEYYNLQKESLEKYVIQSRGFNYYLNKTFLLLSDYYNTVTATSLDNPGDIQCTNDSKYTLDTIAYDEANASLSCDVAIVSNTQTLMGQVLSDFLYLNSLMPTVGNVALLKCFSEGYVFAPSTISDCFDLGYSLFDVEHSDSRDDIVAKVAVLVGYTPFYNGTDLPCGGSSLRRLLLKGETVLYILQRCLYTGSGTTYAVSTPRPGTLPPYEYTTPTFTEI